MEGLLSFLLFAGAFYLMMRFGCGAHMTQGHGKHEDHSGHNDHEAKQIDPVCGMEVDMNKGYGKMHEGQLYRFCSKLCLDKFDSEPERYLKNENGGES